MDQSEMAPLCYAGVASTIVVALFGLALSAPDALAQARGGFDRTLKVSGAVTLDVKTGSGSINVQPGPAGAVHVVGRIEARDSSWGRGPAAAEKIRRLEKNPPIVQTGDSIRLGEIDDPDLKENVSISFEVTVPKQCRVTSRTGSGSQTIGDLDGPVDAGTGSGSVRLGSIGGQVEASSGSGSIEAVAVRGDLRAHAGSGSISAREVRGAIDASTGSGDIEVTQSGPGDVRVSTGSGSVRLDGIQGPLRVRTASGSQTVTGTPTGTWDLSCASGSITLRVPESAGFDLDAESHSGSIDSRHPITMTGRVSRHSLRGQVRGGGPTVRLSAASGSIRIE